ncbi:unnamed protein product [Owenia fusiformis]|uniref:Uncharacterized protein n=1 Tax=Owenia fusiformis TaxID=6347 RepID=A0A8J1Y2C9_OWEFU|nr:unnamed protein product [Owenia fusiformis]
MKYIFYTVFILAITKYITGQIAKFPEIDTSGPMRGEVHKQNGAVPSNDAVNNSNPDHPEIETTYGRLRGAVINQTVKAGSAPDNMVQFTNFLGIPYAAPPVGELRWRLPEAHSSWNGTLDATHYGASCPQRVQPLFIDYDDRNISEDCLFLNIFSPIDYTQSQSELRMANLTVMFYIHGGAFEDGDGIYFGGFLAVTQNVIVVTVNYRLNVFGFLSTESATAGGNYGLYDTVEALKWVQSNIRNFGGNPDAVTIFGESAGGASVSNLVLSPLTKGLFHRAISQSGVATSPWGVASPGAPAKMAEAIAEKLSCSTDNEEAMIACMKTKSTQAVRDAYETIKIELPSSYPSFKITPTPVIDGKLITDHPNNILKSGNFEKRDYLAGYNSDEGYFLWGLEGLIGANLYEGITQDQLEAFIGFFQNQIRYPTETNTNNFRKAVLMYYNDFNADPNESSTIRSKGCYDYITDLFFAYSTQTFADYYSKKSNMYLYFMNANISTRFLKDQPQGRPDYILSSHTDDIPYVFGFPKHAPTMNATIEEQELSGYFMEAWANFAKFGNPNPRSNSSTSFNHHTTWKLYNESTRVYQQLTTPVSDIQNIENVNRARMAFWGDYIYEVVDVEPEICEVITTSKPEVVTGDPDVTTGNPSPSQKPTTVECSQTCTDAIKAGAGVSIQPEQVGPIVWSLMGVSAFLLILSLILIGCIISKNNILDRFKQEGSYNFGMRHMNLSDRD